jgi:hypothetical protein
MKGALSFLLKDFFEKFKCISLASSGNGSDLKKL